MIRDCGKEVIVLDGADGAGKTTQIKLLTKKYTDFEFMKFPNYNSDTGFYITEYLNGNFEKILKDLSIKEKINKISTLYTVDRVMWFNEHYNPFKNLICDRYTTSNILHMAALMIKEGCSINDVFEYIDRLEKLEYFTLGIPRPSLVIYLDVPTDQLAINLNNTGHSLDIHEDKSVFEKIESVKSKIIERCNWQVIKCTDENGMRTIEDINKDICTIIDNYFYNIFKYSKATARELDSVL